MLRGLKIELQPAKELNIRNILYRTKDESCFYCKLALN